MSADIDIDAWLLERGVAPSSRPVARAALEAAGLTRSGKARMSTAKLPRALETLTSRFFLHCLGADCLAFAKASGREPLLCEPRSACERCGGSDNQRATRELLEACRARGVTRVVIVGGSPSVHEELARLLSGSPLEVRLVDGTERRPIERAKADLDWAHLVLVWGATELHHKVSMQYTSAPALNRSKLLHVTRRGITQLFNAAVLHLR